MPEAKSRCRRGVAALLVAVALVGAGCEASGNVDGRKGDVKIEGK